MKLDIFEIVEENLIIEMTTYLSKGLDLKGKNHLGLSALHLSISKKYEEIALLLIEHGADIYSTDNHGLTTLHFAAQNQMYDVVKAIIQKEPESLHVKCNYGAQPLWYAVHNLRKPFDIITLFLEKGADKDHGNEGTSAIERAKSYNINEVTALFDGY